MAIISLRKIWWLASFPKSGNTLARMMVNCYVTKFPLDINSAFQYTTADQQEPFYQHVAAKPLSQLQPAEIAYLRPAALMHYLQLIRPRDACFKTHNANIAPFGVPLIPSELTKGAVYLVRDPRDVAISYAAHSAKSVDQTIDAMGSNDHVGGRPGNIQDLVLSWSTHVHTWTTERRFPVTVVRFEDLIADREAEFRRIIAALGLVEIFRDVDARVAFALEQTEFANLKRLEQESGFRETLNGEFFRVGKTGQWRDILTPEQVERIETAHGKVMGRMGYELSLVEV